MCFSVAWPPFMPMKRIIYNSLRSGLIFVMNEHSTRRCLGERKSCRTFDTHCLLVWDETAGWNDFFLLFLVLSVFLFQNPIASTSPEQSVAPLKKKKFRIGTSLCETALIISWAKTPPRTAADGLISPNVTLKEYSISSERCNEIIWYINNIQEAQLTWMKHSLLPGYRFSFRVKYDL